MRGRPGCGPRLRGVHLPIGSIVRVQCKVSAHLGHEGGISKLSNIDICRRKNQLGGIEVHRERSLGVDTVARISRGCRTVERCTEAIYEPFFGPRREVPRRVGSGASPCTLSYRKPHTYIKVPKLSSMTQRDQTHLQQSQILIPRQGRADPHWKR